MITNITIQLMLNENLPGSRLWSQYEVVRKCKHQLHKAETRGIVIMLAYSRLIPQALKVYQTAVMWGIYSAQANSRPFTLRLMSSLALEEVYIIVVEFLSRIEREAATESMNIFLKMEATSTPNTGIKQLNCIR